MKKRATFTIDEDVFNRLKLLPRGISMSEFVNDMLKGLVNVLHVGMSPEEIAEFESESAPPDQILGVREWVEYGWFVTSGFVKNIGAAKDKRRKGKGKK